MRKALLILALASASTPAWAGGGAISGGSGSGGIASVTVDGVTITGDGASNPLAVAATNGVAFVNASSGTIAWGVGANKTTMTATGLNSFGDWNMSRANLAYMTVGVSSVTLGAAGNVNGIAVSISSDVIVNGTSLGGIYIGRDNRALGLVVVGPGTRAPNSGTSYTARPLGVALTAAGSFWVTDSGDATENQLGVDNVGAFTGPNVAGNIHRLVYSNSTVGILIGATGGVGVNPVQGVNTVPAQFVVRSSATGTTIQFVRVESQSGTKVFGIDGSTAVIVSSGTKLYIGGESGQTVAISSAPSFTSCGNDAIGTLATGTTFFAFVPQSPITVKSLTFAVDVAGVGGSGDRFECNQTGLSGMSVTSAAAAVAGVVTSASGATNMNAQQTVFCHEDSAATTRPIGNLCLTYVMQ